MSSTVIDRKVSHILTLNDQNRDGVLELADWELWVERLAAIRGWTSGSEEYTQLEGLLLGSFKAFEDLFGRVDGGVHIDALTTAMGAVPATSIAVFAEQFFRVIDADGDGVIGAQEYRDLMSSVSIDGQTADDVFAKLDLDGDGNLSWDEFLQLYQEFFSSQDPDAPGSWFWGPF